jgi:hypothetical protein
MKIRIINSKDEIPELDPKERVVHLTIPPVYFVLLELVNRCPELEAIEVPPSQLPNVSKPFRYLMEVRGVEIFEGRIWGHRTDMTKYCTVDDSLIIQRAEEHRAEGLDSEEIVAMVAREVEFSPGLVEYILGR